MSAVHVRRDTRRHLRKTCELPVIVRDPSGASQRAIHFPQVEVSAGGAFLPTDLLFEGGEHLELELIVAQGKSFKVLARVVRVNREPGVVLKDGTIASPPGVGLEFIDPDPEIKALFSEPERSPTR